MGKGFNIRNINKMILSQYTELYDFIIPKDNMLNTISLRFMDNFLGF